MLRRPKRETAGQLPSRFRDDLDAPSPQVQASTKKKNNNKQKAHTMRSSLPESSPEVQAHAQPEQEPPGSRRRGRPRKRVTIHEPRSETGSPSRHDRNKSLTVQARVHYPDAAFPTLDAPLPAMKLRSSSRPAEGPIEKRDSIDVEEIRGRRRIKDSPDVYGVDVKLPAVWKLFHEGRYIDRNGHTMHGLAAYYDKRAGIYDTRNRDNQGDSEDKNAAYRDYLNTEEAQTIQVQAGSGAVTMTFERLWMTGAVRRRSSGDGVEVLPKADKHFKDERFAALHFKLQWCMICDIEEDLARYRPHHLPMDATSHSYRYARNILDISSSYAIKSIKTKIERALNDPKTMPRSTDYWAAAKYLKEMGLPKTLIELYNYLE